MFDQLETIHPLLPAVTGSLTLLLLSVVAYFITKRLLLAGVHALVKASRSQWDDVLIAHNVFGRLSQIVPATVISANRMK